MKLFQIAVAIVFLFFCNALNKKEGIYAQDKNEKEEWNVKIGLDNMLFASKPLAWRKVPEVVNYYPSKQYLYLFPSIYFNKNNRYEIGIATQYLYDQASINYENPNWQKLEPYTVNGEIISQRNYLSLDFSLAYNIKQLLPNPKNANNFIKRSNLYAGIAAKLVYGGSVFLYYPFTNGEYCLVFNENGFTPKRAIAIRPKLDLYYSYDLYKSLYIRLNMNYSYMHVQGSPFVVQAGFGFNL